MSPATTVNIAPKPVTCGAGPYGPSVVTTLWMETIHAVDATAHPKARPNAIDGIGVLSRSRGDTTSAAVSARRIVSRSQP